MAKRVDRVIIKTLNLDVPPDGNSVKFNINPNSVSIDQASLSSLRKTRKGYVKSYFGEGAFTLSFNGTVVFKLADNENNSMEIKETPGWRWFQRFSQFIRKNQSALFQLHYLGTPIALSVDDPVFVGDCSPVRFSQDANNPYAINYSFVFTGVLYKDVEDLSLFNQGTTQVDI